MNTLLRGAAAYLDHGSGCFALQGLIAGIVVIGFTIKKYWHQITEFFAKERPDSILDDKPDNDSSADGA